MKMTSDSTAEVIGNGRFNDCCNIVFRGTSDGR